MNPHWIFKLLLLAPCVWLLSACGTFEVGIEPTPTRSAQATPLAAAATAARDASTPTPDPAMPVDVPATPTATALSPVPQANMLYLGTLSGRYAVFVRNTDDVFVRSTDEQPHSPSDSYLGLVINENGSSETEFDFRKLEQPQQILSSNLDLLIYDLKIDRANRLLYAALIQLSSPTEYKHIERIIEINPADLTHRDVWTLEIPGHEYPGVSGSAVIDQVEGHFLTLRLFSCYACGPALEQPILVLNTETGREKFLGLVGDVILDLRANTVLYRNLQSFREKCEPSPFCDKDGYGTIYAPAGEVLTEQLP